MSADRWNGHVFFALGTLLGFVLLGAVFSDRLKIEFDVGNLAEWTTGGATAGLIAMAWWQLRRQTFQQQQWATLQVCDRYDTDPLLADSVFTLRALSIGECPNLEWHRILTTVTRLFNYFDAIAIGLDQKLYVEAVVRAHLGNVMQLRLKELRSVKHVEFEPFQRDFAPSFESFARLVERWQTVR